VSHAVAGLEEELGVALLIRDRRQGLALSEVGKRVLAHAREIVHRVDQIGQEAEAEKGLEVGTVRIGSFPSASAHFVPRMISVFRRKYPNVNITLLEGTYPEVEDWLSSRVVDIGIILLPNSHFDTVPLAEDNMLVVLPKGHPLAKRKSIPIKALDNEPFIVPMGYEGPILHLFEANRVQLRSEFQALNTSTILKLIEEGLGLTILGELALPGTLALPGKAGSLGEPGHTSETGKTGHTSEKGGSDGMGKPGLIVTRELDPPFHRRLGLACPSFKDASPAVQLFVQTASGLFPGKA
jgi:DNA-binding transcriptional LysR family regulator